MKRTKFKLSLLTLLLCVRSLISAQDKKDNEPLTSIIIMDNGDKFIGTIIEKSTSVVTVKTDNATLQLDRNHVKSIKAKTYSGKFKFKNPNESRYFFGNSALPLEKGRGYYQNSYALLNSFNYGITNNFSMGAGFEFISLTQGSPFWYLTPKLSFKVADNLHLGVSSLIASAEGEFLALNTGTVTIGNPDTNISVGVGIGSDLKGEAESTDPIFTLSAKHRITNSISLVSENYIFNIEGEGLNTFGIHGISIISSNNSFDLGFIVVPEVTEQLPAIPYVSYVRKL